MDSDPSNMHTLWNGVLSAVAGIMAFFTLRLVKDVDEKADETSVKMRFEAHAQRLDAQGDALHTLLERQDKQHSDNTARLDQILQATLRNRT